MPNTSATGGSLLPDPSGVAPLEGQDLYRFFQQLFSNVTGLDGTLIRPAWQGEPPTLPDAATAWMALGITRRPSDKFPPVYHDGAANGGLGKSTLMRQEILTILSSTYDLGVNGQADYYSALLRDAFAIGQNREPLQLNSIGFVESGDLITVPALVKQRWMYRVDCELSFRRLVLRDYAVLNIVSAGGDIRTQKGSADGINQDDEPWSVAGWS